MTEHKVRRVIALGQREAALMRNLAEVQTERCSLLQELFRLAARWALVSRQHDYPLKPSWTTLTTRLNPTRASNVVQLPSINQVKLLTRHHLLRAISGRGTFC